MTLIIWDGETLAADKLSVAPNRPTAAHATVEKICVFDDPLEDFSAGPQGKNLVLLAAAYSGSVSEFSIFHKSVFKNKKLYEHETYLERMNFVLSSTLQRPSFSGIFLASRPKGLANKIEAFVFGAGQRPVRRLNTRPAFVAIGSGAALAREFRRTLNLDAVSLVKLVSLFEKNVGNGVDYLKPYDSPEVRCSTTYQDRERDRHIASLTKHIKTASMHKRSNDDETENEDSPSLP